MAGLPLVLSLFELTQIISAVDFNLVPKLGRFTSFEALTNIYLLRQVLGIDESFAHTRIVL